jgi:hypothetical protein
MKISVVEELSLLKMVPIRVFGKTLGYVALFSHYNMVEVM